MRRCARKWAIGRERPDLPKGLNPTRWLWLTSTGALLRRRPITTEAIGSAATHPSLRGALATKQSRGHNMRGASNPDGRIAAPSLAMTDRELAHLFLRVA